MEHRHYPRLCIALEVAVFQRDQLLDSLKIRDISLEGLFLETGAVDFQQNDLIGLRINISGENHFLRGLVIHKASQGVGVMLIDMSREAFQALFYLFKQRQVPLKQVLEKSSANVSEWPRIPNRLR